MIERFALVDGALAVNIILWDSDQEFEVPDGCVLVKVPEDVSPGWTLIAGVWVSPTPVDLEVPIEDPLVITAKTAALDQLVGLGVSDENARLIVGLQ
jgi:hypothetical protein